MRHLLLLLFLAGCGASSGTGGEPAEFTLGFRRAEPVFTTRAGWSVTLSQARVSVGPLHLYERPAPTARFSPLDLVVRRAHAHSGFDDHDGGTVFGELAAQVVVDVLAGAEPVALSGIAGRVRSASLGVEPSAELGDHVAHLEGVAAKEGVTVPFVVDLDLPEGGNHRRVVGIPVDLELRSGSEVEVALHPDVWLGGADLDPGDATERPFVLAPGSQPYQALQVGIRAHGAFTIAEGGER